MLTEAREVKSFISMQSLTRIGETFEKCDIFLSGKEGKNFNRRNTLGILRIKICCLTPHHEKMAVLQRSRNINGQGGPFQIIIIFCNCSGSKFRGSRFKVKLIRPHRLSESDGGQVKERLYECGIHKCLAKSCNGA